MAFNYINTLVYIMNIQVYSDLHLELYKKIYPKIKPIADILVLAGDIGKISGNNYKNFIYYCSSNWKHVILILGNHEFYHKKKTIFQLKKEYQAFINTLHNIYLLDNSSIVIDNIRFIGSILWSTPNVTDKTINDYNKIWYDRKINVNHQILSSMNNICIEYIIDEMTHSDEKVVLVTHFPIHNKDVSNPIYKNKDNSYFCNNYLDKIKNNVIACIHGHTHHSIDMKINGIRLISNPIGYADEYTNFKEDGLFSFCIKLN